MGFTATREIYGPTRVMRIKVTGTFTVSLDRTYFNIFISHGELTPWEPAGSALGPNQLEKQVEELISVFEQHEQRRKKEKGEVSTFLKRLRFKLSE